MIVNRILELFNHFFGDSIVDWKSEVAIVSKTSEHAVGVDCLAAGNFVRLWNTFKFIVLGLVVSDNIGLSVKLEWLCEMTSFFVKIVGCHFDISSLILERACLEWI